MIEYSIFVNEKIKNRTEKILFDLFFTYYNYYIIYNKISVQWRKFYHILPSNHKISVRSIIVELNTRPLNAWISVHELFQEPWREESSKKRAVAQPTPRERQRRRQPISKILHSLVFFRFIFLSLSFLSLSLFLPSASNHFTFNWTVIDLWSAEGKVELPTCDLYLLAFRSSFGNRTTFLFDITLSINTTCRASCIIFAILMRFSNEITETFWLK